MGAEDFDKMQAYKIANGQVNANPLVDKDGMINLAMDYESEQESEGIVQKCIGLAINDFNRDPPTAKSGLVRFPIYLVLVRVGPEFSKFPGPDPVLYFYLFWSWSSPILGPGPKRSIRDQSVLVR